VSPLLLLITVAFASYGVVSTLIAAGVVMFWRRGRHGQSAAALALLRLLPAGAGALVTAAIVVPAFIIFEPVRASEPVGPFLIAFALIGVAVLVSAIWMALRTVSDTARLKRLWLQSAERLDVDSPSGITTYVIDSATPIVALIGVFSPRLIAARAVVDACTREEFAVIVAHEQGHRRAHDNFKRWLLACAPDVLRWTRVHDEIALAWRDASEDAADDAAAHDAPEARLDLAALLLKVARLAPNSTSPLPVSAFADADGLERRVRRLLSPPGASAGSDDIRMAAVVAATAMLILTQPPVWRGIYDVIEFAVRLGR